MPAAQTAVIDGGKASVSPRGSQCAVTLWGFSAHLTISQSLNPFICLCFHTAVSSVSLCQHALCLSLLRTHVIAFRVHSDNPGSTPLLKIFELITYFAIQIYIHRFWRLGIEYILEKGVHFSTYHIQPLMNTDLGGSQPAWQPD